MFKMNSALYTLCQTVRTCTQLFSVEEGPLLRRVRLQSVQMVLLPKSTTSALLSNIAQKPYRAYGRRWRRLGCSVRQIQSSHSDFRL